MIRGNPGLLPPPLVWRAHLAKRSPRRGKNTGSPARPERARPGQAKFEVEGLEMLEKPVSRCGKSGRVYVPLDWVGKSIKIIRID